MKPTETWLDGPRPATEAPDHRSGAGEDGRASTAPEIRNQEPRFLMGSALPRLILRGLS